jgi:sodium-dependent phosphate transporter
MNLSDYSWLVIVGALAGFVSGFGNGSNDLANAVSAWSNLLSQLADEIDSLMSIDLLPLVLCMQFGTSVGSKTLTLKQAVLIAAVWEFAGAMLLGRVNTSTIQGGIADLSAFQTAPEFYAYGMVISLTVAGVWSILSSYLRLQTSGTHSISKPP